MIERLSAKTRGKFAQTFKNLIIFDKARRELMFDDEPDMTPQQREHREMLLLGQRGDFNYHLWLLQEMFRIRTRLIRNGWNGLTKNERAFIREVAQLKVDFNSADSFRVFAERSLAIAERYFDLENQSVNQDSVVDSEEK